MDTGSPISLDFNFAFSTNSPQVTGGNGGNGLVGTGANSMLHNGMNQDDIALSSGYPSQHRTSIDSMLDQDTRAQWSDPSSQQPQRHSSTVSFGNEPTDNMQDQQSADGEKLPAWSELKTKAGKERKRLPLACIACRRKKIKCSGEKPACKHCLRARVPCVYKVTTRKAAPRTDYMGMLDKRLKRMEDRVIKMIPKDELPDLTVTGRASVRPPLPGQPIKKEKATSTNKRSAEEAFESELSEWTHARKPTHVLDKAARGRNQREADNKLFTEGAESLPPQNIQEHLAEIFFDCVYGQSYLLLHKPSFMRKLKAGTVPPVLILAVCAVSARFSTHPQVNTEPVFLRGEQWATPARSIAEKRHFEPNITILTTMIILGLHYFGTCEGGLSWSFGGQATRMGYALQLHQELDHDPLGQAQAERTTASGNPAPKTQELSFTDREIRRRLMWACYLMDTFNSSGTERPSLLSEDYLKIQLPIKESNFQLEMPGLTEDIEGHVPLPADSSISPDQSKAEARSNMGVAAYVIRAMTVWKRIVQYLNLGGKEKDPYPIWDPLSQFASLQRQITQLESGLPERLKYTPGNLAAHVTKRLANQFLFLHIVIAQTGLFLHRFAIPTAPNVHRPYPPNTPKAFLASSAATVVESAAQISHIVADSTGHTLTVPFAGYCSYAAATVHVWGIFSRNTQLEATSKENLRHSYRYLTRMKRYWGMFHYMAESVKDIYRAFTDASAKTRSSKKPGSQSTVTTRGDTRAAIESIAMSLEPSRDTTPTPGRDEHTNSSASASTANNTHSADSADDIDGVKSANSDNAAKSPNSRSKSEPSSAKSMFQYGDWFNKYPHGVSETEWESTHLPHRGETQKGTEAVMSQQSDLQSVEEFFASLSPPSKSEHDGISGQRSGGRKVARKRGKSIAENIAATAAAGLNAGASTTSGVTGKAKETPQQQQPRQTQAQAQTKPYPGHAGQKQQSQAQLQLQVGSQAQGHPRHSNSSLTSVAPDNVPTPSDIDFPMQQASQQQPLSSRAGSAFDMTSPVSSSTLYPLQSTTTATTAYPAGQTPHRGSYAFSIDSPATASNAGSAIHTNNPQMNFNFNYTSALPHLDRQMVFGAYAGIDASNSSTSAALNNPNNLDFWNNPWDPAQGGMVDMNGFVDDPFGAAGAIMNAGVGGGGGGGGGGMHHQHQHQHQHQQNHVQAGGGGIMGAAAAAGLVQGAGNGAMNSSAWFMPFNIEPPEYGMDDFDVAGLEDMDLSGNDIIGGGGGGGGGSYTGQSNTPA